MSGRRRRMLLLVLVVLAGLLPPVAFLAMSWYQTAQTRHAELSRYAAATLDRAEDIFGSAETTLDGMAAHFEPRCSEATYQGLRRAVFESLYFQEATLVIKGLFVCSSNGINNPAPPVTYAENRIVPDKGIHISPPVVLTREKVTSIVIHRRAGEDSMFGLVLNPVLLGEPGRKYAAEDRITLAVQRNDGYTLAQFGYEPTRALDQTQGGRVVLKSTRYPISVVAVDAPNALLQDWRRNAVIFASAGLLTSALLLVLLLSLGRRQFSASAGVQDALADDQFQVYYQPVIDSITGACIGAESLLRWHHPQLGVIMPDTFIQAAEESGFIVQMTKWVMGRIVTDMAQLLKENPDFYVSLNLSPQHFEDPRLLKDIRSIFGTRVAPGQIVFEVTEHELIMGEDSKAGEVLKQIRAAGMKLAIDDFGSGYSSLKYLGRFQFDYLKIDKSFIDAIGTESLMSGLVDTIVRMGNQLKLKIVAEGVETPAQLNYLHQLDVHLVQGWLFSKALPADQFRNYMAANRAYMLGAAAGKTAAHG